MHKIESKFTTNLERLLEVFLARIFSPWRCPPRTGCSWRWKQTNRE